MLSEIAHSVLQHYKELLGVLDFKKPEDLVRLKRRIKYEQLEGRYSYNELLHEQTEQKRQSSDAT